MRPSSQLPKNHHCCPSLSKRTHLIPQIKTNRAKYVFNMDLVPWPHWRKRWWSKWRKRSVINFYKSSRRTSKNSNKKWRMKKMSPKNLKYLIKYWMLNSDSNRLQTLSHPMRRLTGQPAWIQSKIWELSSSSKI